MPEPADGPRPHLLKRQWLGRLWFRPRTLAGLQLVFDTNRPLARRLVVVSVVQGLLPTVFTVAGGRLVGAAQDGRSLLIPLIVVAVAFFGGELVQNLTDAIIEGFRGARKNRVTGRKGVRYLCSGLSFAMSRWP